MSSNSDPPSKLRRNPARPPIWTWYVVIAGYFLPSLIGISVWSHLRTAGKPVMSFPWIVSVIPILSIFSAFWVLPFVSVAVTARYLELHQKKFAGMIYGAFVGTTVAEVLVFGIAWTNVEIIFLGFLSFPRTIFLGTLIGATIGFTGGWLLQVKSH